MHRKRDRQRNAHLGNDKWRRAWKRRNQRGSNGALLSFALIMKSTGNERNLQTLSGTENSRNLHNYIHTYMYVHM